MDLGLNPKKSKIETPFGSSVWVFDHQRETKDIAYHGFVPQGDVEKERTSTHQLGA